LACDVVSIAIAAFLLFVAYNLALNYGERRVSAGTAGLLIATAPLFTALLAAAMLRERLGALAWVGVLIGFSGAALIAGGSGGGFSFGLSALAVLAAAAAEAPAFILQKRLLDRYGPLELTAYSVWAATVMMLPF